MTEAGERTEGVMPSPVALAAAGIALLGAIGCALRARAGYTQIKELERGMSRVADGNYDVSIASVPGPCTSILEDFDAMARSLRNAEAMREDFLSTVAHEFKTPLSYLQESASLLQDESIEGEERDRHLRNIVAGTRRLSSMVSGLLEFALASSPDVHIESRDFFLDESLRHAVADFVPIMERRELAYNVELESVAMHGAEPLLQEVWANLLSNAVKFTPAGGTVSVSLVRDGDHAVVKVADTGIGMDDELRRHAFDRFYRAPSNGGPETEGTGLGLAIARAIVRSANGTIGLESAPGVGTTCTVRLPLAHSA